MESPTATGRCFLVMYRQDEGTPALLGLYTSLEETRIFYGYEDYFAGFDPYDGPHNGTISFDGHLGELDRYTIVEFEDGVPIKTHRFGVKHTEWLPEERQ